MAYKYLENRILSYCRQEHLFRRGDTVIVGVSGGADSVCLLHVLDVLKPALKIKLSVVHVNHMLRENAREDAAYVRKLCEEWNIPCLEYSYPVEHIAQEEKLSLEEAGRMVRYQAYEDAMVQEKAAVTALAHHMDDQVETILWNLFRGSGGKGLSGIAPKRDRIVRPLLCINRKEIEDYLKAEGISWRTDETNASDDYTRNRLRNRLIPEIEAEYNSRGRQHIADAGGIIAGMEDYISRQGEKAGKRCIQVSGAHSVLVKRAVYEKTEPVLRDHILHSALCRVTGTEKDITSAHIRQLEELMQSQVGREMDLPYRTEALRIYEGICIRKKAPEKKKKIPDREKMEYRLIRLKKTWMWRHYTREKEYTKWFDYDIIEGNLSLRTRQPGDYLVIDEAGNTQKLKSYFINQKIPKEERDSILLLAQEHEILWVVGYRISEKYKVRETTENVLQVSCRS